MTYFRIEESELLIPLLVRLLISSVVLLIWTYSNMNALLVFKEVKELQDVTSDKYGMDSPAPGEFARLKTLLLQATDTSTGEILDISAFIRFLDGIDQYLNNHWEQLPEETRTYVLQKTRFLPKVVPDERGRYSLVAAFLGLWELRDRLIPNLRRLVSLYQKAGRADFILLLEKLQALVRTVQRLREREQKRIEFQQKLAQYPDWDREEQIQKNQGAIKTMQDWLSKEVSEEKEIARDKHYRIFERNLNRDLEKAE